MNALYKSIGRGRMKLTDRGTAYHNDLKEHIAEALMTTDFEVEQGLYRFYMVQGKPTLVSNAFVKEAHRAIKQNRPMRSTETKTKKDKKTGETVEYEAQVFTSLLSPWDADGPLKPTQDIVFGAIGVDDGSVISSHTAKGLHPFPALHLIVEKVPKHEALHLLQVSEEVYDKWISER